MALDTNAQRANKSEKEKSEGVLMELWRQAFETGRVEIPFEPDSLTEANCIFNSLKDYRKKILKKSTENYDMYLIVNAVAVKRPNDFLIILEKKAEKFSDRTTAILNLIHRVPELKNLDTSKESKSGIENILGDFAKMEK